MKQNLVSNNCYIAGLQAIKDSFVLFIANNDNALKTR